MSKHELFGRAFGRFMGNILEMSLTETGDSRTLFYFLSQKIISSVIIMKLVVDDYVHYLNSQGGLSEATSGRLFFLFLWFNYLDCIYS